MEKFKIAVQHTETKVWSLDEVEGERIIVNGLECFIFAESEETEQGTVDGYNISDLKTGYLIANGLSPNLALIKAERVVRLDRYEEMYKKVVQTTPGITFPVNT